MAKQSKSRAERVLLKVDRALLLVANVLRRRRERRGK